MYEKNSAVSHETVLAHAICLSYTVKFERGVSLCGRKIKFKSSPPCACRGSTGQKP